MSKSRPPPKRRVIQTFVIWTVHGQPRDRCIECDAPYGSNPEVYRDRIKQPGAENDTIIITLICTNLHATEYIYQETK